MPGVSARLTDGMKNDAGMRCESSSRTRRPSPRRAPYCAEASVPTVGSPKRRGIVSLSTSNDSSTATRAPPGQLAGASERPARTAFTTVRTESMVHCQPGLAGVGAVCALSSAGRTNRIARRRSMRVSGCGKMISVAEKNTRTRLVCAPASGCCGHDPTWLATWVRKFWRHHGVDRRTPPARSVRASAIRRRAPSCPRTSASYDREPAPRSNTTCQGRISHPVLRGTFRLPTPVNPYRRFRTNSLGNVPLIVT